MASEPDRRAAGRVASASSWEPAEFSVQSFVREPGGVALYAKVVCDTGEAARRMVGRQAAIHGNAAAVQIAAGVSAHRREALILATAGELPSGWFDLVSPLPGDRRSDISPVLAAAAMTVILLPIALVVVAFVVPAALDRLLFSLLMVVAAPIVFVAMWFLTFAVIHFSEKE
ncbi:hypothetical protein [Enterovirga rhinocerotis]|uniref:Uncharacterized protein n=1 Tax=Enterovirga rhinocerotis TaxID=1339210 RepID=A0A4R7C7K4_9HYPH|nr:hypothetical protein [Enterovirga rhinocerotis]TDR93225.1 hypothetical protein EV668_0481 [Enterovirga rhinocerotis]